MLFASLFPEAWWVLLIFAVVVGTAWVLPLVGRRSPSEADEAAMRPEVRRDPVCGMEVSPERVAARSAYRGRTYSFCTEACRKQFEANPAAYVKVGG